MSPRTVWLASYPKSGNTWTRAVLRAMALARRGGGSGGHARRDGGDPRSSGAAGDPLAAIDLRLDALGGGPIASSRAHLEVHLGISTALLHDREVAELRPVCDAALDARLPDVRFRKIHDRLRDDRDARPVVPPAATRAAVYLMRDPRDIAVSLAHHNGWTHERSVRFLHDPRAALDRSRRSNRGQVGQSLGRWDDHVVSWTDHDLFPVRVVRYEDLRADPVPGFAALAAFAGLEVTGAEVAAAVEAARFERLRDLEAEVGFQERPHRDRSFFRRGVAGGWRDELADELAEATVAHHGVTMAAWGYTARST